MSVISVLVKNLPPSLPTVHGRETADKLVLTDSKGEKSYYRAKGDALEMLIVKAIRLNRGSTIRWNRHDQVYL